MEEGEYMVRIIRKCSDARSLGRSYREDFLEREKEYDLCQQCKNNITHAASKNCGARESLKEWCNKWAVASIVVGCPSFQSKKDETEVIRLGEPPARTTRKSRVKDVPSRRQRASFEA